MSFGKPLHLESWFGCFLVQPFLEVLASVGLAWRVVRNLLDRVTLASRPVSRISHHGLTVEVIVDDLDPALRDTTRANIQAFFEASGGRPGNDGGALPKGDVGDAGGTVTEAGPANIFEARQFAPAPCRWTAGKGGYLVLSKHNKLISSQISSTLSFE